jgi:hypothetical protein
MSIENVLTLENGTLVASSNLSVYGVLNAAKIQTNELIAHTKYDAPFFEFSTNNETGTNAGHGFVWPQSDYARQFIWRDDPSRFWATDSIDLAPDRAYHIAGIPVLSQSTLGGSVTVSNLQQLGTLDSLSVGGDVNLAESVYFNANTGKLSIGTEAGTGMLTVYDTTYDVELVITGGENSRGRIGAVQTKSLDIITDDQARISVEYNGDVTISNETDRTATTRVYGKVGVNVKNPREDFEVAGNIRWANKLFATGNGAPTEGAYMKGDMIWNDDPKAMSYIGWVCTQSGAPGEWKPFGLIGN